MACCSCQHRVFHRCICSSLLACLCTPAWLHMYHQAHGAVSCSGRPHGMVLTTSLFFGVSQASKHGETTKEVL